MDPCVWMTKRLENIYIYIKRPANAGLGKGPLFDSYLLVLAALHSVLSLLMHNQANKTEL